MELQENPIVVKIDKMSWGRNWRPIIRVAVVEGKSIPFLLNVMTKNAMYTPLATTRQATERKATINLPPSSPSRGPMGRIVLIIPKRRILNSLEHLIVKP